MKAWSVYTLGNLAVQFKKWVAPAIRARYQREYFDQNLGWMEGRYRSMFKLGRYVAEQVAKATTTTKITPKDIGQTNIPVFETLDSVLSILPNKMTGQEIMDKYEIAFPINKFTTYSPSK